MRKFRKILILLVLLGAFSVGLSFYLNSIRVTPILMYHSIDYADKESTLHVTPENFKAQVEYLHDNGYKIITLGELVSHIESGIKYIPKTVVITFDDGFKDNYVNAFPVLVKYDMPATIFLISSYTNVNKKYLTRDQIRLMNNHKINFGGHTRDNVYLPSIKDNKGLFEQINGCKNDIEQIGINVEHFCYPTGGFNETVKELVRKAGYKSACTTNRGPGRKNKDVFSLKRVKITNSDTVKPLHFWGKLSGYYNGFRGLKRGE